MKTVHALMVLVGLFTLGTMVYSQEEAPPVEIEQTLPPRALGSQSFQIDLGLLIPLFLANSQRSIGLSPGGALRLKWGAFVDSSLALGVDLSGSIAGGPNTINSGKIFSLVNIGPHITNFFRAGNFQIPVSFSPALSIMSYGTNTYVGFGLRPGIGVYYDATPTWSFGLNVNYWWVPEIYANETKLPGITGENRFGNILEVSLSALYSF